jgi:hypothetical protein
MKIILFEMPNGWRLFTLRGKKTVIVPSSAFHRSLTSLFELHRYKKKKKKNNDSDDSNTTIIWWEMLRLTVK